MRKTVKITYDVIVITLKLSEDPYTSYQTYKAMVKSFMDYAWENDTIPFDVWLKIQNMLTIYESIMLEAKLKNIKKKIQKKQKHGG